MLLSGFNVIYRRWRSASLSAKIVVPIVSLMIASLLLTSFAFMVGTDRSHNEILQQEVGSDMAQVSEAFSDRVATVKTAAGLLARDTEIAQALSAETQENLLNINRRALVLRERLGLDLVQVYNRKDESRINLLGSNLFRQSSLLDLAQGDAPGVRAVGGRLLLLSQARLPEDLGTVVTGIDLESELQRLATEFGLRSKVLLKGEGLQVSSDAQSTLSETAGQTSDYYIARGTIQAGQSPLEVVLLRPTADIQRVTTAGLTVTVLSSVLTTVLLIFLAVAITRVVVKPVHRLAEAAQSIARGDLAQRAELNRLGQSHDGPTQDEIALLAQALDHMVTEMHGLHQELESKVVERTRELIVAQERYRRFFEEDLAGDFICSPSGHILACNPAFARIFGYSAVHEMLGLNIGEFYASADARETFWRMLASRKKLEYYEAQMIDRSGAPVHIIENVVGSYDGRGDLLEIKGYILDNSERKKLEEQLRQAQKMEAVGRLAGGVAHDFNNLLTVIIGYSNLILSFGDQSHASGIETILKQIETIKSAGERAAVLTRQLLAFSRKQVLQPKVLNLNEVSGNMSRILKRLIGEDIEMILQLDPAVGLVNADPGQIEQVILNLAVNARDAMPDGGKLIIETSNVVLDHAYATRHVEVQPGLHVMLAVSDTGTGIAPDATEHIFEPFFTTKESGTGLGLATVYGIIRQSGGHIEVYSEVGQGATFKIYLPRVDAPKEESLAFVEPAASFDGSGTILLVEDEDMVRAFTADVLRRRGYQVLEAAEGRQALDVLQQHEEGVELVLTDVVMPGMNGSQLANRIRELQPDAKVLFMSGYTDTAIVHHGVLDPGVQCIQKPFTPDALAKRVKEMILERSQLR